MRTAAVTPRKINLFDVHRKTAMQILSGPPIPEGQTHIDAVHPIPVATTVKVASTEVMEQAFRALMEFNPKIHEDLPQIEQIYRRIGSQLEVYLNLAMSTAEGVGPNSHWALSFSDGMRAINASLEFTLRPGDEVVISKPLYGCTDDYFAEEGIARSQRGYVIHEVDLTNPQNIVQFLNPKTKIVYFETVTNPNLRVYDLETISRLAKGENPNILIVVDNTFPSPAGCNPLLHGADISVHSATKVLGGFTQEMAGVAVVPKALWKQLFLFRKNTGGVPAPDQIHNLLTRGLPSLYVRFVDMQANAIEIADYLAGSAYIQKTHYPGLTSSPYHANARKLLTDWDGNFAPGFMIAFVPLGRTAEEQETRARGILDYFSDHGEGIITHAVSLGGNKSLAEMPFLGTHATVPAEDKARWEINEAMIRLSVGMAHHGDQIQLLADAIRHSYR
ncbi:hypothetical protein A3H38_02040 [candidate division WOR-1 bacterium RIFCSPLOWO2_02_FULL_46_20]|uniref:Cystathionine gamma-synthase n=2 Tax=Saganbacteria TaxID=1703751 RepID=A0A1F4R8J0_UNCSA|nr:MAG: hypothetical protein A3H38_02040 [candidate division WOR-1 bacterium RIFCSPLOWO2_02_FULL_46_20]